MSEYPKVAVKPEYLGRRFYLPDAILEHKCKQCGRLLQRELGDDYLEGFTNGEPSIYCFFCNDCDIENLVTLKVTVTLEFGSYEK